ncbi:MAG: Flp pilus assembly complex ATPase component TadA [Armatimonadetes bacterium]|nr:Flp pilus assembly complex ATPase component TadA [Armatimonadota bacterium]
MQTLTPPRLGDLLVQQGAITAEQLHQALEQQRSGGERLGTILMGNGWANEEQITEARAVQMDVPYVNVAAETPDAFALALISPELASRCLLLPLSLQEHASGGDRLRAAMADPWDVEAIDQVQRAARRRVEPMLASEGALLAALERAYHSSRDEAHAAVLTDSLSQADLSGAGLEDVAEDEDMAETLRQSDQAPVIRFVNTLFSDAIRRRASDIHIEPRQRDFQIRYRVDGQLQAVRVVPRAFLAPTVSRIKIMAEMDIAERRLPLDGRIAMRLEGRSVDMRVSTLPTRYGERVVMRILDRSNACLSLEQLGFSQHNHAFFDGLIRRPHGIILVTGPTGSGKTTTLYAALNALKSPTTNIITCEDPIEYELEGISQSNVNERAGLTFARQLRAILRQDPDVVLVGEIRDAETAEIAFRAALTGHLVLSTLHCNEAAGAASRLLDMGVAPFLIASALIGAVAQRLVPRLCPHCRRPYAPDADERAMLNALDDAAVGAHTFYEPAGCPQCDNQGIRGRAAVHEIMPVNNRVRRLIMAQAETEQIRQAALEAGMVPMFRDGLEKAAQGVTTLEGVQRKVGTGDE